MTGVNLENSASKAEARGLLNHFNQGNGTTLSFRYNSNMSRILGEDPAFVDLAHSFEQQALIYYNNNGSLEGFQGNNVLQKLGMPYIKDTWFMHTVLGGTQQWNAQVTKITASEIKVRYTVWDRFGAGTDDAKSRLPGLSSLYWLQHNSAVYFPEKSKSFAPFTWNINVNR